MVGIGMFGVISNCSVFFIYCKSTSVSTYIFRDYVRGGSEGALAPPEFRGSKRRTEGETDNPLLIAPSESKS